jgi:hypothetical protein
MLTYPLNSNSHVLSRLLQKSKTLNHYLSPSNTSFLTSSSLVDVSDDVIDDDPDKEDEEADSRHSVGTARLTDLFGITAIMLGRCWGVPSGVLKLEI